VTTTRKAPAKRRSATRRATPKTPRKPEPILLDIACGQTKPEGWVGIDLAGDADIVHDLFVFPWPIDDATVSQARCSHFVEHIPHWRPGWSKDGWWLFFDELDRILIPEGTAEFWHPYSRHDRADWDPTHERAIHENTWYYLDAAWREAQGLSHYPTDVNFEVVLISGLGIPDPVANRSPDYLAYAREHLYNVVADLHVTVRKRITAAGSATG
jgi:hypothetical protein